MPADLLEAGVGKALKEGCNLLEEADEFCLFDPAVKERIRPVEVAVDDRKNHLARYRLCVKILLLTRAGDEG